MHTITAMTTRNIKLFVRDRATVFFSFLSTIILVALYFLFVGKMYMVGMDAPELGVIAPTTLTLDGKNFMVYLQMMAGVLVLNSLSLSTGAFSTVAKDFEQRRIDGFTLTTTKGVTLVTSYFLTGFLVSFIFNTFTWVLSFIIIGLATGYWVCVTTFASVLLVLVVASLISSSIVLLITLLIKSSTAIGVINGVSGTFFGFLCGIYMPFSNLGDGVKAAGSVLPLSHMTIWMKQVMLGDAFDQLGIAGRYREVLQQDFFSANSIGLLGHDFGLTQMMLFSGFFGLLLALIGVMMFARRYRR